ncbi:MAG: hypothetical protein ACE361_26950 [Aureliella sp.]
MTWKWNSSRLWTLVFALTLYLPGTSDAQVGDGSLGGIGEGKAIQVIQVTPKGVETPSGFDELATFTYEIGSLEPMRVPKRGEFGMAGAAYGGGDEGYGGGGPGMGGMGPGAGMGMGGGMGPGAGMGMGGGMGPGGGMGMGAGMGMEGGMGGGGYGGAPTSPTMTLNVLVRRHDETSRIEEITVMTEPILLWDRSKNKRPRDASSEVNEAELWLFKSDIANGGGMYGGGYGDYSAGGGLGGGGDMEDMYGGSVDSPPTKLMDFHYLVDRRVAYAGETILLSESEHSIVCRLIEGELRREDILRLLKENSDDVAKVDELEADLKKVIRSQYQTGLAKQKYEIELVEKELEVLKKEVARREAALERVVEVQAGKLVLEAQGLIE